MPRTLYIVRWLGRGAEIDIGPPDPYLGRAVELAAGTTDQSASKTTAAQGPGHPAGGV